MCLLRLRFLAFVRDPAGPGRRRWPSPRTTFRRRATSGTRVISLRNSPGALGGRGLGGPAHLRARGYRRDDRAETARRRAGCASALSAAGFEIPERGRPQPGPGGLRRRGQNDPRHPGDSGTTAPAGVESQSGRGGPRCASAYARGRRPMPMSSEAWRRSSGSPEHRRGSFRAQGDHRVHARVARRAGSRQATLTTTAMTAATPPRASGSSDLTSVELRGHVTGEEQREDDAYREGPRRRGGCPRRRRGAGHRGRARAERDPDAEFRVRWATAYAITP